MNSKITCIIIDDEKLNREEIKLLIKESNLEIDILGQAENGQQGLELIDELLPDLVITDIKMPCVDGINMITQAKQKNQHTKFIITSGYAEFEYASKAISLGVSEYLLKPLVDEVVFGVLKESCNQILTRRAQIESQTKLSNQNKKLLLEQALKDVFMFNQFDNYNQFEFNNNDKFYCLAVMQMYYTSRSVIDIAKKHECENIHFYKSCFRQNEIIAISYGNNETDVCKNLVAEIEKIIDACTKLSIETATGISKAESNISRLNGVYTYCLDALMDRFLKVDSAIYRCKNLYQTTEICNTYREQLEKAQSIFANIRIANKLDNYQDGIELLIELCKTSFKDHNGYLQLRSILSQVFSIILLISPISNQDGGEVYYLTDYLSGEIINTIGSYTEIEITIRQFTSMTNKLEDKPADIQAVVYQIKQMVDLHYNEDLQLENFSEKFYVEAKYLSKVFKKTLEINFSDYLTGVRIKRAKEFLLSTEFNVQKIASLVGYNDHQYFHRVFKIREGKTPNEYRMSIKNI